jgi:hypothetical protein
MCIAVKTFGTEAVANNLIAEIIIFDKNKRFDVRGDATGETIIKSIKAVEEASKCPLLFGSPSSFYLPMQVQF